MSILRAFWFLVTISFCLAQKECTQKVCKLDDTSLRFFIMGDWGGMEIWPYYTLAQTTVAAAMEKMGQEKNTHFQVTVGDNFYKIGVKNVDDSRFKSTFENVYGKGKALSKPWYMIAGNHDHYGNISAQIEYTQRSNRWVYPSLYYSVKYSLSNGMLVEMFLLDTIVLCGNTREGPFGSTLEYTLAASRKPPGPKDAKLAETQWSWLENGLRSSKANYLFVVGHYPVWSVSKHGPTQCMIDKLKPLLEKYRVSAYLAGHDHSMQHLNVTTPDGLVIHHIVSGTGAKESVTKKIHDSVPAKAKQFIYPQGYGLIQKLKGSTGLVNGGFVYAELTPTKGTFKFVTGNGKIPYEFTMSPRTL